jgi:hypothetical protein
MFFVLPLPGRISMTRFSPPERHTRDERPAQEHRPQAEQPEREQPKFRRIAILASVPGLSRPD